MFQNILIISLTMSAVILLLLIISPLLSKRYSAKWRYFVWLILAIRLVVPFRMEMPKAPVNIAPVQNQTIVFQGTENSPITIMDDSYRQYGNTSPDSADYAPIISVQQLAVIMWSIGAILFFLHHIIGYAVFKQRIKAHCQKLQISILENILHDMNIRKEITILTCNRISSPMMIGFIKPTILLPETEYTDAEMDVIIRHELTHYKRLDLWYKLLLITAKSIHFFNPLVYLMVKQANRDLEYSCDDAVIRNSDLDFRKQYSLTILKSIQRVETTPLSTYLTGGNIK